MSLMFSLHLESALLHKVSSKSNVGVNANAVITATTLNTIEAENTVNNIKKDNLEKIQSAQSCDLYVQRCQYNKYSH